MSFKYPYKSYLRKQLQKSKAGLDYQVWRAGDLSRLITNIQKPVIEIGGPTQDGFFFLDDVSFNTEPTITNISQNPLPFSANASKLAKQVAVLLDATAMPYDDSSVGVFLMASMSLSSDWWVELSAEDKEKASTKFEQEFANARFEMGQVAAGILDPTAVKNAQRVKIYLEVSRCLDKDGLFFTDGGIEEIAILKGMGFELIACLQVTEKYGFSYEFVVAKRF